MKRTIFLWLLVLTQPAVAGAASLEQEFASPPATAGPWVYWMWPTCMTTPEAMTKDLEEMHAKGIRGLMLYDSGTSRIADVGADMVEHGKGYQLVKTNKYAGANTTPLPAPPLPTWSAPWRELVRHGIRESGRLDLKFVLTNGLSGTSGAIGKEDGQQRLVFSDNVVDGGAVYHAQLETPNLAVPATAGGAPRKLNEANGAFAGHDIALLAFPDKKPPVEAAEIVDLSNRVSAGGQLKWEVPAGRWHVMRFGYQPTGARNQWGLYTDHLSADAMDHTWDVTMGPLLKEMTPEEHKHLLVVEDDSWEAGEANWTRLFQTEFKNRRGYDLVPLLPALAGITIHDTETTAGIRRDYYRTIADLIAENHYKHLTELCHRNGLVLYAEAAGPNTGELDTELNGRYVDHFMAEFWAPSAHRPTPAVRFLLRNAATGNHVWGHTLTACESLTSLGPFWEETFFSIKNTADQGFCDGCNLNVIHNYSHSPSLTAKPGYVYFAGTLYNRQCTWWEQSPTFSTYLARCCHMLQQGLFVADALYYRGDGIGGGEPAKTKPAIPAPGYDHDNCDLDALLERVSTKDGRIVLPDGMSYRMLVLPPKQPMEPRALEKIAQLADAGATIVGPRPTGMAGFQTDPSLQKTFDATVDRLWSGDSAKVRDLPAADELKALRLPPDITVAGLSVGGELDWIHRRAGDTDIYFIASLWNTTENVDCTLRVSGRQPEIWDPVTGHVCDALAFHQHDGLTTVPLHFDPKQSIFIVFRKPIAEDVSGAAASNQESIIQGDEISGPWTVNFDPKWGGPESATFDSLVDWTTRPEPGIKFYSGTAVYHAKFSVTSMPVLRQNLLLNLGEVHEIAEVTINGQNLGVLWTKPARVNITSAAHVGENTLEIEIVNLWPNRLIGDAALGEHFTETNMHKFSGKTPLLPSGLIGPVRLEVATPWQSPTGR